MGGASEMGFLYLGLCNFIKHKHLVSEECPDAIHLIYATLEFFGGWDGIIEC